jgi:PAS domain S-box-containing protein
MPENLKGIQGVGFAIVVPAHELAAHTAWIRSQGFPEYSIWPKGNRDVYTSVIFIEPFSDRNLRAFGYDMWSEPVRRQALTLARDSNICTLTGKIRLVQETSKDVQAGCLMYLPVYKNGKPHGSVEERRTNFLGWAYLPFRMHDLMNALFRDSDFDLDIEIFAGDSLTPGAMMYNSSSEEPSPGTALISKQTLQLNEQRWTIKLHSLPSLQAKLSDDRPKAILFIGISLSIILSFFSWQLTESKRRIKITAEKQESLYKTLVKNASSSIFIIAQDRHIVECNEQAVKTYGYSAEEFKSMRIEDLYPPELVQSSIERFSRLITSGRLKFESTHRRKSGTLMPCEVVASQAAFAGERLILSVVNDITERKEEELRNKENQLKYQILFQNRFNAICVIDLDSLEFLDANDTHLELYGYSLEELCSGMTIEDLTSDSDDSLLSIRNTILNGATLIPLQYHRKKDGTIFPVEIMAQTAEWRGRPVLFAIVQDITQRKMDSDTIRESEEKYRLLVNHTSDLIWNLDTAGNFTYVSPSWYTVTGTVPEEVIGTHYTNLIHPDDLQRMTTLFADHIITGQLTPLPEYRVRHADKTWRWHTGTATPVRGKDGTVYSVVGVSRDITEQKTASEMIRDRERWFHAMFNANLAVKLLIDPANGKIIDANQAAAQFYGYSVQRLKAMNINEINVLSSGEIHAEMQNALNEKRSYFNFIHHLADGRERNVEVYSSPIEYNGSSILHSIIHDTTERTQAQEALKQSEALLRESIATRDKFYSIIAHDLRSPFHGLKGIAELLSERFDEIPRKQMDELVHSLRENVDNTFVLLNDLLIWTKSQTHSIRFTPEQAHLTELVDTAALSVLPIVENKKIEFSVNVSPLLSAFIDSNLFLTVVRNLLSNAVKFTPEGGRIRVQANQVDTHIFISVEDSGIGIEPELLENLFSKENTLSKPGTGLGLLLCREFVERNGGTIMVTSAPGKGSNFTFSVPVKGL